MAKLDFPSNFEGLLQGIDQRLAALGVPEPPKHVAPQSPAELGRRCWPGWMGPRHVQHLDRLLVDAAEGKLREQGYAGLVVEMPPRHGKSTHCSHWFPSWFLGKYPTRNVILTSYEADFAASWGRRVRDTLQEHGQREFGVGVSTNSSSASRWETDRGGGMITAGAGGAITGRGAHLLLIDDPVKNAEEAASATVREAIWDWYLTTARTRVEPGGIIVVIMTRWHPDDLVGRILRAQQEDRTADKFLRVRFPALAEGADALGRQAGEALWPERYPVDELDRLKATVGNRVWAALYQQDPVEAPAGTPVYETTDAEGADILQVKPQTVHPRYKIFRGWDFGYRVPVCICGQIRPVLDVDGRLTGKERLHILREISLPDSIIDDFADHVLAECRRLFPGAEFKDYGDPAGNQKSDKRNETSIQVLASKGISLISRPSPIELGINIVQSLITQGGIEFDPQCKVLLSGLRSGYVRDHRGEPVGGAEGHPFTDHCDAFRYLCLHLYGFNAKSSGPSAYKPPVATAQQDMASKHFQTGETASVAKQTAGAGEYRSATAYRPRLGFTRA